MVGAELGDQPIAHALLEADRLGEPAGGLVRDREVVELGPGVGMVRTECALGRLGGLFGHLQDFGVASTAVMKNVRECALR